MHNFARFSGKINILLQDLVRLTVFCKNLARSFKINILSRLGQVVICSWFENVRSVLITICYYGPIGTLGRPVILLRLVIIVFNFLFAHT